MTNYELQQLTNDPKYQEVVIGWLEGRDNSDPFISEQYTTNKLIRRITDMIHHDIVHNQTAQG